jgi:16S rRNA (guanine527-N7)-methyltransferase
VKRRPQPPEAGRLAALAADHGLDPGAAGRLELFVRLLAEDPHAPTAVQDPAAAVDVHIADSLAALPLLDDVFGAGAPARAADLGSGAGLPGIPLALARPAVQWDLIEARRRRCEFLGDAVDLLGLDNARVRCQRAEELAGGPLREAFGAVLARAVAPLAVLAEYAAPLLGARGALVAWKGRRDPDEERRGAGAAARVGLEPAEVRRVTPYADSVHHHLYLYRKVRSCPPEYPRRAGVARRKPLA